MALLLMIWLQYAAAHSVLLFRRLRKLLLWRVRDLWQLTENRCSRYAFLWCVPQNIIQTICPEECAVIYCRVPARQGLQRTARAATRHGARDPLVRPQVDQKRNEPHTWFTFFTKTGWAWHVTIWTGEFNPSRTYQRHHTNELCVLIK